MNLPAPNLRREPPSRRRLHRDELDRSPLTADATLACTSVAGSASVTANAAHTAAAAIGPPTAFTAASPRVTQSGIRRLPSPTHVYGQSDEVAPGPDGRPVSAYTARGGIASHRSHGVDPFASLNVPGRHRRQNRPVYPGGHAIVVTEPATPVALTPPSAPPAPPRAENEPSGALRLDPPVPSSSGDSIGGKGRGQWRCTRPPPPPPPPLHPPPPPSAATRPPGSTESARVKTTTVPPLPPPPPPPWTIAMGLDAA